jgi:hypothetical protein
MGAFDMGAFATGAFAGGVFAAGFAVVFFIAEGAICDAGFALTAALVAGFFAVAAVPVDADCAHDIAAVSITIKIVFVTFIACLPYRAGAPAFAGPADAAGASWLKNVVAVKLETTLSEGEYL